MTLSEFIQKYDVSIMAVHDHTEGSTNKDWNVTVLCGEFERAMPTKFYTGDAEGPTVEDVLYCLALDARTIDDTHDFPDWAEEFGYTEIRNAWSVYQGCQKSRSNLIVVFGERVYNELLEAAQDYE